MPYMRTAQFYGMLHGYPDGSARPANTINRVEMLKFISEASTSITGNNLLGYESYYTDVDYDSWYAPYLGIAYELDLFNENHGGGYLQLHPAIRVDRGEVALSLYKMFQAGLLDY